MMKTSTYRPVALALAVVFALFNCGLPVVLDSCPMPKATGSMTCAVCHPLPVSSGQPPVLQSPRCCAPVLAAERNTTAFVPSHKASEDRTVLLHAVVAPSLPEMALAPDSHLLTFNPSWSPPVHGENLPVLHSALLI